jgi:hypothetical protein
VSFIPFIGHQDVWRFNNIPGKEKIERFLFLAHTGERDLFLSYEDITPIKGA